MSETLATTEVDPFDVRRVRGARGLLDEFNEIGVLAAADVHVAARLAQVGEETGDVVMLAAAFAVRAPRLGHVYVDLETVSATATVDSEEPVDLSGLPWPDPEEWVAAVERSALVTVGDEEAAVGDARPLRLVGSHLYLDRYWREERQIARDLREFASSPASDVRTEELGAGLTRLFETDGDLLQQAAAATAVLRRFSVIAGGPGTGKTTTVARIVALLAEQAEAAGAPRPVVAMAAPTAKAAARLTEAVHEQADVLKVSDSTREALRALEGVTLHRLLGWRPRSHSRYRHDRTNRLPHDVVIVDETSMVSLTMMARLVEAVRRDARLILIGDPGQLTSIEAGAVLGDIVGPANDDLRMSVATLQELTALTGRIIVGEDPPEGSTIGDATVVLNHNFRFGGKIAEVARAIRRGDGDAAIAALSDERPGVVWVQRDVGDPDTLAELGAIRSGITETAHAVIGAAKRGNAARAIEALGRFRILCAHRRGDYGVDTWIARVEGWLGEQIGGFGLDGPWYVGRPLLVTRNDYGVRLFNGDTGVVVADKSSGLTAAFGREGKQLVRPSRLESVETVYAMTIHKSQGSQFDTAVVLLPPPASPILTRELLYTAVTRAREQLILVGTEESVRAAIARPVARASGLRARLWGDDA